MPDAGAPTPEFHVHLADGPEDARAWSATARDGTTLRIATWPAGHKGTVLIFPGRNEYVEKYGRVARTLTERGLASAAIDWRGQGMSERAPKTRNAGHVAAFEDYHHDVEAYLAVVREAGLPGPYYLIGHSMGGAIGLGALAAGLPVRAAAFSAPMWGIQIAPALRPAAERLPALAVSVGLGTLTVPVGPKTSYMLAQAFEGNALTSDPETWAWLVAHARHDARLALGRPTFAWLGASLRELRRFAALPPPTVPVYVGVAGADTIVDNREIEALAQGWPGARLERFPDARHELMMERAEIRDRFLGAAVELFESAA